MSGEELKHALQKYNRMIVWVKSNEERIIAITLYSEGMEESKKELIVANHYYYTMLETVDDFILWLEEPIKSMVQDKYIKQLSDVELELDYNYCRMHMMRMIEDRANEYILKKMLHVT